MTMLRRSALTVSVALLALAACGDPDAVGQPGPTDPPPASPTSDPAPTAPTTASTTAPTDTLPPETLVPVEFRYDPEALRAELDAARGRWVDGDHDAYRFEYQYVCFCDPDETRADVEVIDGRVVNDNDRGTFSSVDEWFDIIDQAIGTAADVRVAYADAGYPTSLYIDVEEQMADEEFGLDQIAVDFHGLPQLDADASPEQVQSFVTGFFEALDAQSPSQPNLEPALAV